MKLIRSQTDHLIACLRDRGDKLCSDAADTIDRMRAERLKLDKRIHNQRAAAGITWEIVEMRRKWLGSDTARAHSIRYLKRAQELKAENERLRTVLSRLQPKIAK